MLQTVATVFTLLLLILGPTSARAQDQTDWLDIEVGKSIVLETPRNVTAIAITDPEVADVVPLAAANKLQVQGKNVGSTDLVVQLASGAPPIIYEITVHHDLSDLIRRVDAIVEGEPPRVYPLKERIVVEGPVEDLETLEQVSLVASIYDEHFINLMTVRGDHQVQLEVVFAEVSRSATREIGMNFLWGNDSRGAAMQGPNLTTSTSATNTPIEGVLNGGQIFGAAAGTFQLATYISQIELAAVLSIMQDYNLSKILAQPTIVVLSGQQGEFLAGGEIPIPAPSGAGGGIRIEYKEYGIKLVFVPTVLGGDVIDMRVYVEVSEPDFAGGTRITGIEVPGFVTRKGRTHLRIDNGMTFAMAGMLSETTTYSRAEIPGLGRIPVIGTLFRYTKHFRDENELLILVTPRLVRPLGPGEIPAPPGTTENNNPTDIELFLLGMDRKAGSRTAKPTADVGLQR